MAPPVGVEWESYTSGCGKEPSCFLPSWKPTDLKKFHESQQSILGQAAKEGLELEQGNVPTVEGETVHCIRVKGNGAGDSNYLVLHGFGGGSALWAMNMKAIASKCGGHAYYVDLPGFGRSSRGKPPSTTATSEAEDFFLDRLEGWRKAVGLDSLTVIGHSFGAYLTACYAMKYPQKVASVVLVDPWGVGVRDEAAKERSKKMPWYIKAASSVAKWSGPLFMLRASGPWGPSLLPKFRPDLVKKWDNIFQDGQVSEYVYHCNAQSPATGEELFMALQIPFGWAKNPLLKRTFATNTSLHVIYGEKSWMSPQAGRDMVDLHTGSSSFAIVSDAGHHVYIDNIDEFNAQLVTVLE